MLFRAMERPAGIDLERDLGWGRLARGGLEIHDVPGSHATMILESHVRVLARILSDCLNRRPADADRPRHLPPPTPAEGSGAPLGTE
jgi:thioesterase domain-containing protein